MTDISVVIPVGPDPAYKEHLGECLESVFNQTHCPAEVILIDDGADLYTEPEDAHIMRYFKYDKVRSRERGTLRFLREDVDVVYYKTLWNVGVADAFNFGISLSSTNLVFTLGSDDKMMPACLEEVVKAYEEHQVEGWYNVTHITQAGELGDIPNNTAAVTKKLWRWLGGFPPSAGIGACDALALSILIRHAPERIIQVQPGIPLCWLREGDYQDTRQTAWRFGPEVISVRNKETLRWTPQG